MEVALLSDGVNFNAGKGITLGSDFGAALDVIGPEQRV